MTTNTMERTDIVQIAEADPAPFILDRAAWQQFLARVKEEVSGLDIDLTTEKGRKAIASTAYKIAKCKTAIDAAGKDMNEEARAKIKVIDTARKEIRDTLDALKDEVRRPLTEWEEAEKVRQEKTAAILQDFTDAIAMPFTAERTVERMEDRLQGIVGVTIDAELFGDQAEYAEERRVKAVEAVKAALETVRKEEADRAELERLRKAEVERAEQDRLAAEKREREEREAREAKAREEAAAKAAAEAEERHKREAAEAEARAKRMAEEAAEKARAEERQRIEREQRERVEREAAEAKEAERQARNKKHRREVEAAAAGALAAHVEGLSEEQAQAVITAIAAGYVPRVAVQY